MPQLSCKSAWDAVRRFCGDTRGLIAIKFAIATPIVATLAIGATEISWVYAERERLGEIADAAALAGAVELGLAVDGAGPVGRARAYVDGHLADWDNAPNVTIDIQVVTLADNTRALRVSMDGRRTSFLANTLPPGGWQLHAEAIATSVASVPLCVLTFGSDRDKILNIKDQAQIRAPACMVHSNGDIVVEGGRLSAAATQVVARASGSITPTAVTGAVRIPDPFSSLPLGDGPTSRDSLRCSASSVPRVMTSGRHRLSPGVHCNGISVEGTAELILEPGEHWFVSGALVIKEDARLSGDDVVLVFDRTSKFEFKDHSRVTLEGREDGPYAGIVMAAMRGNTQDFIISSDQVDSLLGVIYVPDATLIVEGSADVARESAWTVIVAKYLQLKGGPALYINANYRASDVPVPSGVGPGAGGSRLIQ